MKIQSACYVLLAGLIATLSPGLWAMEGNLPTENVNEEFEYTVPFSNKILAGTILRCTVIHWAVINNNCRLIQQLIACGAETTKTVSIPGQEMYLTPLGLAIFCNYHDIVKALLTSKANREDAGFFISETRIISIKALDFARSLSVTRECYSPSIITMLDDEKPDIRTDDHCIRILCSSQVIFQGISPDAAPCILF